MNKICKNILITAFLLLTTLSIVSCSDSKVEKELDGKWKGEALVEDDEGDMATFKMYLTFEEASHNFSMKINVSYPGIGKVAVIRFSGSWEANSDYLTFDVDETSFKVKFDDEVSILASMGGMNINLLKRQMEQDLKDEMSGFAIIDIKSLSKNEMTLDIFDANGFFTKMNDNDHPIIDD